MRGVVALAWPASITSTFALVAGTHLLKGGSSLHQGCGRQFGTQPDEGKQRFVCIDPCCGKSFPTAQARVRAAALLKCCMILGRRTQPSTNPEGAHHLSLCEFVWPHKVS